MIQIPIDSIPASNHSTSPDDSDYLAESLALATAEPPRKLSLCEFRIVVDVNEGAPYRFTGFDDGDGGKLLISTLTRPLYNLGKREVEVDGKTFTKGLADYSIDGLEERIQIERKSLEDLYGTLGGRREDFKAEIARLNECEFAAVVIEATWQQILYEPPGMSRLNPRSVEGMIQAWSVQFPRVHWFPAGSRREGERLTFGLLEKFWRVWKWRRLQEAGK